MKSKYRDSSAQRVEFSLRGAKFPCNKSDLISCARANNADRDFVRAVENLPERRFANLDDVVHDLVRM